MLTFLFGRSGSGKTANIISQIKSNVEKGIKTYLLVPEQQVYVSECMLADLPASGALCFEVVSFSRLCELVFERLGGVADMHIGSGVRNLIMWQSLREIMPALTQYKSVKADAALTSVMLSTVDELKANSVTPDMCENMIELCQDETLSAKLSDIAAIYANFERNIAERLGESAVASENRLIRLSQLLSQNNVFSDCSIFIDSFTSFTGEEYAVLEQLIAQAESVCLSVTYERGSHEPHLKTVSDTVKRLTRFAREKNIGTRDVCLGAYKRAASGELQTLEEHLWDFSVTKDTLPSISEDSRGNIEAYVCNNDYEEMYLAALNILKAHKNGTKYSEIALIMRDPEVKKGMIDAVFEHMNIPYFYSERTDLSSTSVARLVLSALRCVAFGFNSQDVMTLLKTGLLGIDAHDADLFEDYCLTWNISGKTFTADVWSMNPDGYTVNMSERAREILDGANRVRAQIIPPLDELRRDISMAHGSTEQNCRALYRYLDKIGLSENLSDMAKLSLACGNVREAGELLRLYDFLVSVITDICTVMSDTETGAEELSVAIEIMMKNTDIGSVPAVNDYVTVGSAATLRLENIKTAVLIGLCEGEFPADYSDNGIFTENDKDRLEQIGISLPSREDSITSDELFYVYRAMTKPSEKLILSFGRSSVSGKTLHPSSAWNRVMFLFPYISAQQFDLKRIRAIASSIAESGEQNDGGTSDNAPSNTEALPNRGDTVQIDPFFVRMLFGNKLYLTKSRISAFAECPYRYWCEYVLKLREQKTESVSYADSGSIIHYILERLLRELLQDNGRIKEIDDSALAERVTAILTDHLGSLTCPLPPSAMYSFSKLRDLSLIMARSIIDELQASDFRIVAFEKPISDRGSGDLKPMEITLDGVDGSPVVSLGGVIDRIDCFESDERKYIRIIDYKTGSHRYNVDKLETGEDLQLPAYLFTAAQAENSRFFNSDKEIFPAAAMFLSAEETDGKISPVRSGFMLNDKDVLHAASHELDSSILAGIRVKKDNSVSGKAAIDEAGIKNINTVMRDTVSKAAKSIYSGCAPRTPSKEACGFCSLRSTCPVASKD